jgi:leucyl-tRNA synthetase
LNIVRNFDDIKWKTWQRGRELRREMTLPERILWSKLKNDKLGTKFRRQHPIGGFILDFVALEKQLVVEIDGDTHFTARRTALDIRRTKYLSDLGFRVIRFTNDDVLNQMKYVLREIAKSLDANRESD